MAVVTCTDGGWGEGGLAELKVCKQCPLVVLVRADRWQGGGMRTAGVRTVLAACCVWSAAQRSSLTFWS